MSEGRVVARTNQYAGECADTVVHAERGSDTHSCCCRLSIRDASPYANRSTYAPISMSIDGGASIRYSHLVSFHRSLPLCRSRPHSSLIPLVILPTNQSSRDERKTRQKSEGTILLLSLPAVLMPRVHD